MEKTKTTLPDYKRKLKKFISDGITFLQYAVLLVIVYCVGYYQKDLNRMISNKQQNFDEINTYESTSVSITERNELMIIDRTTQQIEVYDDTLGILIFNAYSNVLVPKNKISE